MNRRTEHLRKHSAAESFRNFNFHSWFFSTEQNHLQVSVLCTAARWCETIDEDNIIIIILGDEYNSFPRGKRPTAGVVYFPLLLNLFFSSSLQRQRDSGELHEICFFPSRRRDYATSSVAILNDIDYWNYIHRYTSFDSRYLRRGIQSNPRVTMPRITIFRVKRFAATYLVGFASRVQSFWSCVTTLVTTIIRI